MKECALLMVKRQKGGFLQSKCAGFGITFGIGEEDLSKLLCTKCWGLGMEILLSKNRTQIILEALELLGKLGSAQSLLNKATPPCAHTQNSKQDNCKNKIQKHKGILIPWRCLHFACCGIFCALGSLYFAHLLDPCLF